MHNTSFFYLVCFLVRQKFRRSSVQYQDLKAAFQEGVTPFSADFFLRFPETKEWESLSKDRWQKGIDELDRWQERGIQFIDLQNPSFPNHLRNILDPPWILTCLGSREALQGAHLSVVGSREPRDESSQWMHENLPLFLQNTGVSLVSGGARGIDQVAHLISLREGKPTLVFLPSGLEQIYPRDLKEWILPLCEAGGAFLSEFHPRTPMRKWNFQIRNRLIAGLSAATLVVEARIRSGTWTTAQAAIEAGREVLTLPGPLWDPQFSGNLALLSEGGALVRDAQDLILFYMRQCQAELRHIGPEASLGTRDSESSCNIGIK